VAGAALGSRPTNYSSPERAAESIRQIKLFGFHLGVPENSVPSREDTGEFLRDDLARSFDRFYQTPEACFVKRVPSDHRKTKHHSFHFVTSWALRMSADTGITPRKQTLHLDV
jgi:hypothetical protein